MFFEQAREQAEREFKANNKDALVRRFCRRCRHPTTNCSAGPCYWQLCACFICCIWMYWRCLCACAALPEHHAALWAPSVCCRQPSLPAPHAPPVAPQALTKWGGALLELAHFRQGAEAYEMIEEAIGKFEQALSLDAARHDALWCLGNAFTSQGFLSAEAASGERRGGGRQGEPGQPACGAENWG